MPGARVSTVHFHCTARVSTVLIHACQRQARHVWMGSRDALHGPTFTGNGKLKFSINSNLLADLLFVCFVMVLEMLTLCIDVLTTLCGVFECAVLCCRITSAPWCYPHASPTSPSHPSSCTNTSDQQSSSSAATNSTRDTITTTPSSSLFCCSIHTITTAAEQFCLHSSRLVDNDSLFSKYNQ